MTNWDNNTVLLIAGVSVAAKGVLWELEASIEGTRNHRAVGVTPDLESGPAPNPRVPPIRAHYQPRVYTLGSAPRTNQQGGSGADLDANDLRGPTQFGTCLDRKVEQLSLHIGMIEVQATDLPGRGRDKVTRRRGNPPCLMAAGVHQRLVNAESDSLRNTPGMRDLTMDAVTEHRLLFNDHDAGTMAGERHS